MTGAASFREELGNRPRQGLGLCLRLNRPHDVASKLPSVGHGTVNRLCEVHDMNADGGMELAERGVRAYQVPDLEDTGYQLKLATRDLTCVRYDDDLHPHAAESCLSEFVRLFGRLTKPLQLVRPPGRECLRCHFHPLVLRGSG